MSVKTKMASVALATAAAGLFLSGCASSGGSMKTASAEVHCAGVNSCKGQTACKSANNNCKGQNNCKGHGWLPKASKAECESAGGEVI